MLPKGYLFSGVRCGLKEKGLDLGLIYSSSPAQCAAVFTKNAFKSAHILVCRPKIKGSIRAIVVNSGIANAGTGEEGVRNAREMCREVARNLGINEREVLVASTGVIGQQLPMEKVKEGIRRACQELREGGFEDFARAIMTTDTHPKVVSKEGDGFGLLGIAKGAGMIHPQMATMLAFLLTDASIGREVLSQILRRAVDVSFHCLTVDGETSPNDSVFLLANSTSRKESTELFSFEEKLKEVCVELARMIARDGEGATKLAIIKVKGAQDPDSARRLGRRIATSPLVKTALFGNDPNVGRIMSALGSGGVRVKMERVNILLQGEEVVKGGVILDFPKDKLREKMSAREVEIEVELGIGEGNAEIFTCDFSYDYVRINSEYTT